MKNMLNFMAIVYFSNHEENSFFEKKNRSGVGSDLNKVEKGENIRSSGT